MLSSAAWIAALAVTVFLLPGCSVLSRPRTAPPGILREWSATVLLYGKPLALHLAMPRAPAGRALMLYASGDGGWFGAAVDMFHQIAGAGYATVGFSSRAFLKIERPRGRLVTAAQLATDYEQVLVEARRALELDDTTPAVLTGWSRGAAFAVLVGSEPAAQHDLLGVVAIGLDDSEDLGLDSAEEDTDDGPALPAARRRLFDTYARIAGLAPLPCAVIQATHDSYFPAASARQRFGPDTPIRRFWAVEARNHRFSGGQAAFDSALLDALRWIVPPRTF